VVDAAGGGGLHWRTDGLSAEQLAVDETVDAGEAAVVQAHRAPSRRSPTLRSRARRGCGSRSSRSTPPTAWAQGVSLRTQRFGTCTVPVEGSASQQVVCGVPIHRPVMPLRVRPDGTPWTCTPRRLDRYTGYSPGSTPS